MEDRQIVSIGIALGSALGAFDTSIVGTAMPSVISHLGGLDLYSWVFTSYMLASTISAPIFGRLSDIYGEKILYVIGIFIYIIGASLCGLSRNIESLIIFRTIQGIGGGGLFSVGITIIGVIYTPEDRGKMQGIIGLVWGLSSIIAPFIAGFVIKYISWRLSFYIHLPFGIFAALLVFMKLNDFKDSIIVKKILNINLFRNKIFIISSICGFLMGASMFGSFSYMPLFIQGVIRENALKTGIALAPISLGWSIGSFVGGMLISSLGYRLMILSGFASMGIGLYLSSLMYISTPFYIPLENMLLIGMGAGFITPTLVTVVQNNVPQEDIGTATSFSMFFRTIGGASGITAMGSILSYKMANYQGYKILLNPKIRSNLIPEITILRESLANSLQTIFIVALLIVIIGFFIGMFLPSKYA
jgi:MFS family permease